MPEKKIKKLYEKIPRQHKICFFAALVIGLTAHFYKITNWLPNWDSLVFRYDPQNMLPLGRWLLSAACAFSSFYDLPWVNGILCIVLHAAGAVCICKIFNVKNDIPAGLIGAVVVSFPTVTSVLMYNYVADGYALSFFLACLAAQLMTANKPRYIAASLLIVLSVAVYQAYITVTAMLVLLYLTDKLIFGGEIPKESFKKSIKSAGCGILGIALYFVITEILLKLTGSAFLDYQDFGRTMAMKEINITASIAEALYLFAGYFFDFKNGPSVFSVLNILISAAVFFAYVYGFFKFARSKSAAAAMLLALYAALVPIGMNLLVISSPALDYHNLMKMGYCSLYLFFAVLYERIDFLKPNLRFAVQWAVIILCAALIFNNIIIAGVSYHKLQMSYEKSYGTLVRIADRIEQTDGAEYCEKIMIIGALENSEDYSCELPPDMTGTTDGYILRFDDETVGQSVVCSALNDYCGKNYTFLAGSQKRGLMLNQTVKNMKSWPDKSAVAVVDDTIVLKLGTEVN